MTNTIILTYSPLFFMFKKQNKVVNL